MAVSPIKYKLKDAQPKLLPGAHVEVRSLEEGFEGSWHAATVVGARGESSLRRVRYDHLLVDDGSEILVEWIKVSCMLDGFFPGDGVPVNYRGIMRPVPPPEFRVDCWGLHYGLCVDACVSDAWWEGVVFDHGDGLDQRLVFFPDLGDQQMVKIENLRVTHDWGETSAAWTKRGDWLFLQLIQEYDEVCAGVSVRQLWYDVRAKEGFRMSVKEWTCPRRAMWVDLVVEVIRDNMDLRAEFLLSVVIESQNAVNFVRGPSILPCEDQLPVASPDPTTRARSRSATKSYSEDNLHDRIEEDHVASAPPSQRTRSKLRNTSAATVHCEGIRQHHSEENQLALTLPGSCKTTKNTSSGNTSDCEEVLQRQIEEEKQLVLTSPGFDVNPTSTSVHSDPSLSTDVSSVTGIRGYHRDDMSKVQDGRFVQDPIDKFLHMVRLGRKPDYKHTQEEVRMHLSDLGWKIEHIAYNRPVYHYVAPEGRTFNSLIKVCEFLRPSKDNITAQRSQNVDKNLVDSSIASLRSSVQQVPSPQQCFSEGHGGTPPGEQGNRSSSVKNIRVSKIKEAVEVEPEFCPGALLELCGLEARPVGKKKIWLPFV